jgi:exosome complex exonuclease RRP6
MASQKTDPPMPSASFDAFNSEIQGAALNVTKRSLALPSDLAFHRTMDPELARDLDEFSSRVLSIANDLLALVSASDNHRRPRLKSQDDVVDNFHPIVVDSIDPLFERAVR